jgi:hypothetical protein
MLLPHLRRLIQRGLRPVASAPAPFRRPRVEVLEDRTAPAVVSFTNHAGGDWSVPGNWSTGSVPTASDDVVINLPGITVTHSTGTDIIRTLTLSDPLPVTGGILAINGASPFSFSTSMLNQPVTVTGGRFSTTWQNVNVGGAGRVTNEVGGLVTIYESTIHAPLDNRGLLVVEGNHATFYGPFSNAAGATLRIEGSLDFGAGILTVATGFTNAGAIEMTTTQAPASTGLAVLNGTLVNTGSLHLGPIPGGASTLAFALDNQGTFTTESTANFGVRASQYDRS